MIKIMRRCSKERPWILFGNLNNRSPRIGRQPFLPNTLFPSFFSFSGKKSEKQEEEKREEREREMKRKREMEKESEIRSAIEELSMWEKLKTEDSDSQSIPTNHFLSLCNLVLHVLDKIGPTMTVLRQDVYQNIQKIERVYESGTSSYANLGEILKKEANEGTLKKVHSCGRAILWLTRSLDFTVALLQKVTKESELSMAEAVEDSYNIAFKAWHGWISSAAFKIALKLVPDYNNFVDLLKAKDANSESLLEELNTFVSLLLPFLERLHSILILYRLDRLKSP